ncbi:MAG TPA: PQQ-binding-like beta-propeller repeat protein [Gemmataceae bacterium]|nr:PQQ-binding-like beta-propeller repeat protein [Gemmataceae bacterium]
MALPRFLPALAFALTLVPAGRADDWPQFRGPNRDDVSNEKGLLKTWPKEGPPLAWKATGLGGGYSSVSVAGDRIYTLGNKGNVSNLLALERDGGKVLWSSPVGPAGGNLGCTPTVDGDRVYALGQDGDLVCVGADGKRLWHHNLRKEFGGKCGGWNYCESPLVDGDKVVVTPGGKEATMVALAKDSGAVLWKCPIPVAHPEAGYSSVVVAEVGGVRQYVQLLNGGLVGVSADGRFLWKYEKLGPNTANIPTPIVLADRVFASAGYGKGGALLRLSADGKRVSAAEEYFNRQLTNKHGGVVRVGDYLFGDTDDQGRPFCAEVKTGKVVWKRERQGDGKGSASVTYADGRLYFHYDNGVVSLVEASPAGGYKESGSFHVPKTSGPSWAHPVVSGGRLYLREGDMLYCYDVRARR